MKVVGTFIIMNHYKATVILIIVTIGFLISYPFHRTFIGGLISSGFCASMIGGFADWYGHRRRPRPFIFAKGRI